MICPLVLSLVLAHAAVVSTAQASAQQPPTVSAAAPTTQPWPPAGVLRLGPGIKAPEVVKESKPRYTTDARRAGIQGGVMMEAVVQADGTVGDVRVTRSLDRKLGLDDEAVRAVKGWLFKPGTKDGAAVPVVVEIEMTFTVRK